MADKDGIGWAADTMNACYDRLEVANNNLANAESRDFHQMVARFRMTPEGLQATNVYSEEAPAQRATGRPLDLAIDGRGQFRVLDPLSGTEVTETRVGAFTRDVHGYLVDGSGRQLLGDHGPIKVGPDAQVRGDGAVIDGTKVIGKIPLPQGSVIRSGFLEISNVDSAKIMLQIIDAQRSFETAEKVLASIDSTRQKLANEVSRLKG